MPTVQNITLHPWNCQWAKDWSLTMVTYLKTLILFPCISLADPNENISSVKQKRISSFWVFAACGHGDGHGPSFQQTPSPSSLATSLQELLTPGYVRSLAGWGSWQGRFEGCIYVFLLFGRAEPSPGQAPGSVAVRQQHHAMAQDTCECGCSLLQSSKGREKHLLPSPASAAEFVRLL